MYAGKHEFKSFRTLEESEEKFFEKYNDKQIGIEIPGYYSNKNELKIK